MTEKFKLLIVLFCVALLFGGMFVTYNYVLGTNSLENNVTVDGTSKDEVISDEKPVKKVNTPFRIEEVLVGTHILNIGNYNRQLIINSVEEGTGEYQFNYSIPALGKKHSNKKGYLNPSMKSIKLESLGEGTYKHNDDKYFFTSINNTWNFNI